MHGRNVVRYFVAIVALLFFLFVSNDFGLIDVQKTAIVVAVGIDREEDTFVVTSQIALPTDGANQTSEIVSRGKTVAEAFEEINDKTGWYPKLVFLKLILLGENTVNENVFDVLDFFLRDEYVTDDCLVAVCDGITKDFLNVQTPTNGVSALAIAGVLSSHAERVGAVMPNTLREFAASSFGDSKSGYLPVIKLALPQEQIGGEGESDPKGQPPSESSGGGGNGNSKGAGSSSSGSSSSKTSSQNAEERVFSVSETALFFEGKQVGSLDKKQTFAFSTVMSELRLATYTVPYRNASYTLTVKHPSPSIKLKIEKNGAVKLKIGVSLTAGVADFSHSDTENEVKDVGDVPKGLLNAAETALKAEIERTVESAKACGSDVFGATDLLKKYENKYFNAFKKDIFERANVEVSVKFKSVR